MNLNDLANLGHHRRYCGRDFAGLGGSLLPISDVQESGL